MPVLREIPYDREKTVAYAHKWAYSRNPAYFDFSSLGGDCTNFASQCIFAGSRVMNYTPVYGWYYISAAKRSASWTGVQFLYNFLTANSGAGPYGVETSAGGVLPGDLAQLSFDGTIFRHSPVIVAVGSPPSPDSILVAAHTYDADNRPLSTYSFKVVRYIHIVAARRGVPH